MEKLLLTFYLASAIEHNPKLKKKEAEEWKNIIKQEFNHLSLGIYDPVDREAQKTGKNSTETGDYIRGLKQAGHWNLFHKELDKIWWGNINAENHRIEILLSLRNRFLIDGNSITDLNYWGDEEAVIRSDFIIAYMEKNVKTVGTIREIHDCYLFKIPVYLILPDQTKTEANSTLIDMVIKSGGDIFYSINDCIKFIKEKYNIKIIENTKETKTEKDK